MAATKIQSTRLSFMNTCKTPQVKSLLLKQAARKILHLGQTVVTLALYFSVTEVFAVPPLAADHGWFSVSQVCP